MKRAWFLIALTLALMSCRSVRVEYVPVVRDSIQIRTEVRVDSVWRDRWHSETVKGDTIRIHDSIRVESISYRDRSDTVLVHDSIPVVHEVPGPVQYRRTSYDRNVSAGFWILLIGLLAYIGLRIYRKFR